MGPVIEGRVSVIILNWNGRQYLRQCFDSLAIQDYGDLEIVLIDQGSTDGSADYVREHYPSATVVASTSNLGIAEGNNVAARRATGEYLFFINNDAWMLQPDTISRLVQTAHHYPSAAIIGCRILNVDGSIQDVGEKIDALGFPRGLPVGPEPLPDIIDDVFYVTGCAMFTYSGVFRALGGFDGRYFWSHEEVDLAWRARLRGYSVVVNTEALVGHVGGGVMVGGAPGKEPRYRTTTARIYHRECSTLATLLKNYSARSLLRILPVYMGINAAEVLFFLLMRQPTVARQYVRAYWWNLRRLPGTLRERRCIQRARCVSDREITRYFWPGIRKLHFARSGQIPRIDHLASGARG